MSTTSFHDRHLALFDPAILESKRVLCIGAGSVGSVFLAHLVRAGILTLDVWDFDTVAESNLCRTVYNHADVGRLKVDALKAHLESIRPGVSVRAEPFDVSTLDDDELVSRLGEYDLVLATTDHPPTQARIGVLSYPRLPAVFAGVYARGTGGEVLFTLPNETACYHCVLGAVRAGGNAPNRGQLDYGLTTGQLASEPALGVDIAHVTTCAAKVALALLLRGTTAAAASIVDPARNVLFVGNAVDWIWRAPFETLWAKTERAPSCFCRLMPGQSTADLLDDPDA